MQCSCPVLWVCVLSTASHSDAAVMLWHGRWDGMLQAHFAKYEPTILELKRKYELAMKEKMLAGLDRDKMAAKVSRLCRRRAQCGAACMQCSMTCLSFPALLTASGTHCVAGAHPGGAPQAAAAATASAARRSTGQQPKRRAAVFSSRVSRGALWQWTRQLPGTLACSLQKPLC